MQPTLQKKIFLRFIVVIGLLCVPAVLLTLQWHDRLARGEAQARVSQKLASVRQVLGDRIEADAELLAALAPAVAGRPGAGVTEEVRAAFRAGGFDFGGVMDLSAGGGERFLSAATLDGSSFFCRQWRERGPESGFVLVPLDELTRENPARAAELRAGLGAIPAAGAPFDRGVLLASLAWKAVTGVAGGPGSVVYAGRVLCFDNPRVDRLAERVIEPHVFRGKPTATVTLFQGGRRVATNVVDPGGRRAVGTSASAEVLDRVLRDGHLWSDRAWVVDRWYVAAYAPIRDPSGRVIGMTYVGILEELLLDTRDRMVAAMAGVFAAGALAAVLVSWLLSRALTRPLRRLLLAAEGVRGGGFELPPPAAPGDFREVSELLDAFTGMVTALRERDLSLKDANTRLKEINAKLEATNRNYMEMLSFVTHELSNMVGVLVMDAHALRDSLGGKMGPEEQECLASLLQYLDRFRDIIRNYLDLSRIEKDRMEVRRVAMNLWYDALQPACHELAGSMEIKDMRLSVDEAVKSVDLEADPNLLRVVFFNLVGNAVKYGRSGGEVRIRLGECAAGHCRIDVWNEGEGIPPADLARLGEKFFRPRTPAGRRAGGTGLGLYITREILERHGGSLAIDSREGAWAEFGVTLPLGGPAPA
ncbi:MAG: cache domain-containing protein [Acidobacteria bacterium]|nr:cache domain-containing protein [Acidobacteriota bacterium]